MAQDARAHRAGGPLLLLEQRAGTTTSASTVQNGMRSAAATCRRQRSGSRIGFSSPTSSAARTSPQKRTTSACSPMLRTNPAPLDDERVREFRRPSSMNWKWRSWRRESGDDHEEHDQRQAQLVRGVDGRVERRVVSGTLRALHPVDDRPAVRVGRTGPANGHARVVGQHSGSNIGANILRDRPSFGRRHPTAALLDVACCADARSQAVSTLMPSDLRRSSRVRRPSRAACAGRRAGRRGRCGRPKADPRFARDQPVALAARPPDPLHGSLGPARSVPRPRGRQLRGVGLPAEGPARLPPVVRRRALRRPDPRQQPRHDGGHQARGQHRPLRARDLHRRRHVARPARPGRRARPPRRDDVGTDHRLREVQARPETDVAGRARRPVQLLGRRAEGLRGRRGQRQERRDHRLAARPHPARTAGAQPAGRPVAVRHPDHSRDGRQRPRAHRHRRQRREARRGEEDLRCAARVAGQGVRARRLPTTSGSARR